MPSARHHRACACARGHLAAATPPEGFTLPGAEKHYPPDLGLEPVHLDIALTLNLEARRADGVVTTTVVARRDGPRELKLDAVGFEDVAVDDADGRGLSWRYDGEALRLTWDEAARRGEERRVTVRYRVREPVTGLMFSGPTPEAPDAPLFAATDNETERARHWLPCVDLPSVRPTLEFRLRARAELTALANGALLGEETHDDGTRTTRWRLDHRCPSYITCVAVGDFVRREGGQSRTLPELPIAYFATRAHTEEHLERTFGRTPEMLDWLNEKLGTPYPFPKYFQFAVPGIGGAMENISLVSWDDQFLLDEALAGEWTRLLEAINVHEMAHSWFGDLLVVRDFAHAWLKESWATYMEQCWFEDHYGEDEKLYELFQNAHQYFEEADGSYQRPIVTREFTSSWEMYDRHLYPGGACRLHMLRCEMGDDVFWTSVRDYIARFSGEVVETDDFRRVLERHSGRSLGKWFDQWIHGRGYPHLEVSFSWEAERGEGVFDIRQAQCKGDGDGGGEGAPQVFEVPLELGWVVAGTLRTTTVTLKQAHQIVHVAMPGEPSQVRVDPNGRLLHKLDFNPGDDKLTAQLTGAGDVIGRILAGRELAKTGKRKNVLAIGRAWAAEPFYGVRAQWAEALGEAQAEAAIEVLVGAIGSERHAMVLEPLMRAAGRYRDARVREAVLTRLEEDEGLPPRAAMAAWEALGAQREQAPLERLAEAARAPSYNGIAQGGALRALGESRQDRAVGLLGELLAPGALGPRVRAAAVDGLARVGRVKLREARERVGEQLVDLLRDADPRVQRAAVIGLEQLGDRRAIEPLEAHAARVSAQDRVRVRRAVQRLHERGDKRPGGRDEALDGLRDKLRKLQDRVDSLEARLEAQPKPAGTSEEIE